MLVIEIEVLNGLLYYTEREILFTFYLQMGRLNARMKAKEEGKKKETVRKISSSAVSKVDVKKKLRQQMKRHTLVSKLEIEKELSEEAKKAKRRRARPVVGDVKPLASMLDDIMAEIEEEKEQKKEKPAKKGRKSTAKVAKRKKDFMRSVSFMASVANNKTFQGNPLEAITAHVKAKVDENLL